MIDTETVFIIGAGGSKPYNFPTGRELRKNIVTDFEKNFAMYLQQTAPDIMRIKVTGSAFIDRFRDSGIYSIDKFLAFHPGDSYNGKIAIALEILRAESRSKFLEEMKLDKQKQDWYSFLYNRMIEGVPPGDNGHLEFAKNKVSFITFNYDRSLEWFFYKCFSNTFKFNENVFVTTPTEKLIPFRFFHVYGAAKLPWQASEDGRSLEYQIGVGFNHIYFPDIKTMADSLRIIYEDRRQNNDLSEVMQIIENADRVFFLGFGYADENLELLQIPDTIKGKRVFGTAQGLTENEIIRKLGRLNADKQRIDKVKNGVKKGTTQLFDLDCLMLLREFL